MKRAVVFQRDKIWCRWTDDECDVANCSYATCVRRRLLPKAVCGESVKRRTVDRKPDYDDTKVPTVRFKGKTLRKLKDHDYY